MDQQVKLETFKKLKKEIKKDTDYKDYVISINYRDIIADVFLDDYGQSYYLKIHFPTETKDYGCGTYNFAYEQEAIDIINYYLDNKLKK